MYHRTHVSVYVRTHHLTSSTAAARISALVQPVIYVQKHVAIGVHPFDQHTRPTASVFQRGVCSGERRRCVPTHRRRVFQATSRACAQGQPSFPLDLSDYSLPDPLTTTIRR